MLNDIENGRKRIKWSYVSIKSWSIVSERRMRTRCDSSIGFTSINSQMFRSVPFRVSPWRISRAHCIPTNDYLSQFVTYRKGETWLRSSSRAINYQHFWSRFTNWNRSFKHELLLLSLVCSLLFQLSTGNQFLQINIVGRIVIAMQLEKFDHHCILCHWDLLLFLIHIYFIHYT